MLTGESRHPLHFIRKVDQRRRQALGQRDPAGPYGVSGRDDVLLGLVYVAAADDVDGTRRGDRRAFCAVSHAKSSRTSKSVCSAPCVRDDEAALGTWPEAFLETVAVVRGDN
jgi:hypothetical protein